MAEFENNARQMHETTLTQTSPCAPGLCARHLQREREDDRCQPPSLTLNKSLNLWVNETAKWEKKLVVLSSGVQIYRPDCARLKQRTCGEVKSKKTSTEREEGCEDHMSVGVHCVCVCVCSVKWNGRWWWKNKMWETTQVNC